MKFFYLGLLFLSVFTSCSNADDASVNTPDVLPSKNDIAASLTRRSYTGLPNNSNNPYDYVGAVHNEILTAYYLGDTLPTTIDAMAARVELLAKQNNSFLALAPANYYFTSTSSVNSILSNLSTCKTDVINASLLTSNAKTNLSDFIGSLLVLCDTEEDFEVIYNYIVTFEDRILADPTFTTLDKRIILTSSSISRFSAYARKKKPKKNTDPEWDLMVGNIVAGTDGSNDSDEKAIMMALVAGVAQN